MPQITVMGLLLAMRLVMVKDLKQNLKLKRHIVQKLQWLPFQSYLVLKQSFRAFKGNRFYSW